MKFSELTSLASLFVIATASFHIQEVAVTCTDADPTTIYQTVTVTSTISNCGNNIPQYTSTSSAGTPVGSSSTITTIPPTTQSTSLPPPPPTSTTTASPTAEATHTVIVGARGDLIYGPNQLNAAIGDIIRFDFNSTNHTVTQSTFDAPCSPLAGGFNTGFNQVNKLNHTGVIIVDFEVKVSTPLWFYCAQTIRVSHCQKGMVLGVNAGEKFPAFLSMATVNATTTSTYNTSVPLSTGGSTVTSSAMSLNTAGTGSKTTMVLNTGMSYTASPKPSATKAAYRFKRRGAADWYN